MKPSSQLKLLGYKWLSAGSFTVQSMLFIVYLGCMYCCISVFKPWHEDNAISVWLMCVWHVVVSGDFDCPNVHSITFTWDAVCAKDSGLGILDNSDNADVFFTQMCTVLVLLLACSLLIFLTFNIVTVARQLGLCASYGEPVVCFSGKGLFDILMTTTSFLLTSTTYRIKKSTNVWSWSWRHYDSLKCY